MLHERNTEYESSDITKSLLGECDLSSDIVLKILIFLTDVQRMYLVLKFYNVVTTCVVL